MSIKSLKPMNVIFGGERVFVDAIKDLEIRSIRLPWIIQMGPKSNDEYPYKRHMHGDDVKMEAETGVTQVWAKGYLAPREPRTGKEAVFPRGSKGTAAWPLPRL